jgi:uncharacterized protein
MDARFLDRHIRPRVVEALLDTRVVALLGARQVGKSTLAQEIARHEHPAGVLTLDDRATRTAAERDPTGFIAELATPAVIDEVQRVPDVLLAIKQRVDADRRPGQFLLTGSANVLTAPMIADALTGRAEYYRLWPFTQGELRGTRERFIEALFDGRHPRITGAPIGRTPALPMLLAGGYPEAQARRGRRRLQFFDSYVETILQRDLSSVSRVHDRANVLRLLQALASLSGSLLNYSGLSRDLRLPVTTLRAHTDLLETLFLIRRIPPWHGNQLSRVVKTSKVYMSDTGLLAHLLGLDERGLQRDHPALGAIFETFVVMELLRQSAWQEDPVRLYHYRDKDGREVDTILERRDGSMIAIEAKAAASVGSSDFRGLTRLRDALGKRFAAGAVIYTGQSSVPFGDRLVAIPLEGLWTTRA